MFDVCWVRTHLGVVFGDVFQVFGVFGWVSRKMDQMSKNLGNCKGLTPWHSDPMQRCRPMPRRGMPRRG